MGKHSRWVLLLLMLAGCGHQPGGRHVGDDYLVDQPLSGADVLTDPTQQDAVRASLKNARR